MARSSLIRHMDHAADIEISSSANLPGDGNSTRTTLINLNVGGLRIELGIDSESTRLALIHGLTGSGRYTVSVDATIRPVRLPPSAGREVSAETVGARRVYRSVEAGLDPAA